MHTTHFDLARCLSATFLAAVLMCEPLAGQTVASAPEPAGLSDQTHAVLDRFEHAGDGLKDLTCKVRYTVIQLIKENEDDPDEKQIYEGDVTLARSDAEVRSLIHFERWTEDIPGRRSTWKKNQEWFLFDGRTLLVAKEVAKTVDRHEIVKEGEQRDPFKIGEGPFPLPFGQKKEDVLAEFDVTLVPFRSDDPPRTEHIVCRPKETSGLADQYDEIELFISNDDHTDSYGLPLKIIAVDRKDEARKIVEFAKLEKNDGLLPSQIKLPSRTNNWTQN